MFPLTESDSCLSVNDLPVKETRQTDAKSHCTGGGIINGQSRVCLIYSSQSFSFSIQQTLHPMLQSICYFVMIMILLHKTNKSIIEIAFTQLLNNLIIIRHHAWSPSMTQLEVEIDHRHRCTSLPLYLVIILIVLYPYAICHVLFYFMLYFYIHITCRYN